MNIKALGLLLLSLLLGGCVGNNYPLLEKSLPLEQASQYHIGPGDHIEVSVWRNPDLSQTVVVRPDGKISLPLVDDVHAGGLTPLDLSANLEKSFSAYIKDPLVTVMLSRFVGTYEDTIRVVGEATAPQSIPFRDGMTVLDIMILVGGLTDFAAGNRAVLTRPIDGGKSYRVRLNSLIRDGDISANAPVMPGDILMIPEALI
jgi:polysaccharide biosynthesis/export protein